MPSSDLTGQVALVTGAGSGIGQQAAVALARAGADVLGIGRRAEALSATASEHPGIATHPADLREEGVADAVVDDAVHRWGRIDVVVNNAGVTASMPLAEADADRIGDLMAINITAPSLLTKAALPHLRNSGGAVVNVSSTFGHRPAAGLAHYGASKAAIESLTRSWALELAPDGVRVNCVAPGPTESEALRAAGLSDSTIDTIKADEAARIPLARRGDPAEVAAWILRMADPHSAWVTGQVLTVDGGLELT